MWKQVDCRLAITDSPVGDQPERVRCPNTTHTDPNPSASVYADHLYCYGCRFFLKRLPTLAYLLYGTWDQEAISQAGTVFKKYIPSSVDAYRKRVEDVVKTDPLPDGLAGAYYSLLMGMRRNRLAWLTERGLTLETVRKFLIGHDGTRFTIPVYSFGLLLTIRYRRDDFYGTTVFDPKRGEDRPLPKYSGMQGRNGLFLFTHSLDIAKCSWAVVVEGELDAVRLWQEGIPAISPTNGAGNVARVPALVKRDYPGITHLVFATDQDEPGTAASFEGVAAAVREGFSATRLSWDPLLGKDVTEYLRGGHTLEDAHHDGDELPARLHQPVYRPA